MAGRARGLFVVVFLSEGADASCCLACSDAEDEEEGIDTFAARWFPAKGLMLTTHDDGSCRVRAQRPESPKLFLVRNSMLSRPAILYVPGFDLTCKPNHCSQLLARIRTLARLVESIIICALNLTTPRRD